VITATELHLHLDERLRPQPGTERRSQTPLLWLLPKHDKGQFVFLVPGRDLDLPPAPPLDPDANPWRGLEPYESKHADLFFGRRGLSEELTKRVLSERFVVVTGSSGIGKSSLVRAGLLPRLPETIQSVVVRPGQEPFASLARGLRNTGSIEDAPSTGALESGPRALADWLTARAGNDELLLVIDQAEELITMSRDTAAMETFLGLIATALSEASGRLRVVLTVRSEFEPQFADSPLRAHWQAARSLVPQMTQDELRRVIENPAAIKVMRFESDALVDKLINEVVNMPGGLPLLSFALSEMYRQYLDRRDDDRTLAWADYKALEGGVIGSLRVRANQVIDGFDETHQATARRVLERLVSVESGEFARRRVPRRELEAADEAETARIAEILRRLLEARLVVTDKVDDEPYLELAHDALVLGWDRLLTWVRQDLDRIVVLRRLTISADEWAASAGGAGGLLWADAARQGSIKPLMDAATPGLNRNELAFANASARRARRNRAIRWSIAAALVIVTITAITFAINARRQEQIAEANLAAALQEKGSLALSEKDQLSARLFLANSLLLRESPTVRKTLAENWSSGANLTFRYQPTAEGPLPVSPREVAAINPCCSALAVRHDGTRIFAGRSDGRIDVIDTKSGEVVDSIIVGFPISAIAVSPGDAVLAAGGDGNVVKLWAVDTGSLIKELKIDAPVLSLEFRPVTPGLAIGLAGGGVTQMDLESGARVWTVAGHEQNAQGLAYSPDGRSLFWAGSEEWLWLTNADTGQSRKLLHAGSDWKYSIAMNPTGQQIAFTPNQRTVGVANLDGSATFDLVGHRDVIQSLGFSSDGRYLLSSDILGTAKIWDVEARDILVTFPTEGKPISEATFVPEKQSIALGVLHGGVALYRIDNEPEVRRYDAPPPPDLAAALQRFEEGNPGVLHALELGVESGRITNAIVEIDFLRNGDLMVQTWQKPLVVLEPDTWEPVADYPLRPGPGGDEIVSLAREANVVSISQGLLADHIELWSLDSGASLKNVVVEGCSVASFDVSSTSDSIFIGCQAGAAYLYDLRSESIIRELDSNGHGTARAVGMDDASGLLVVGYEDGWVQAWKESDQPVLAVQAHNQPIEEVAVQVGGSLLATASADRSVRVWTPDEQEVVFKFPFRSQSLALSDDKRWLASGDHDQQIHLIDLSTGYELLTFGGHRAGIMALQFSANSATLVSGSEDGTVLIRDLNKVVHVLDSDSASLVRAAEAASGLALEGFELQPVEQMR
jgi:WD40 repeat protein